MNKNGGALKDKIAEGNEGAATGPATPPPASDGGGGGRLERVTVNLVPRASKALEATTKLTGDTKTDTINRALQVLHVLEDAMARGGEVVVRYNNTGELEVLRFV